MISGCYKRKSLDGLSDGRQLRDQKRAPEHPCLSAVEADAIKAVGLSPSAEVVQRKAKFLPLGISRDIAAIQRYLNDTINIAESSHGTNIKVIIAVATAIGKVLGIQSCIL